MDKNIDGTAGGVQIVGMDIGCEVPEFLQDILGSFGMSRGEKGELIKGYLGVSNLRNVARVYKRYPVTFRVAISDALEDLSVIAKDVKKTSDQEGVPVSYALDDGGDTYEDAVFGGEFELNGETVRAVIESTSPNMSGVMGHGVLFGGTYNLFSVYTRKEDCAFSSKIFDIVDGFIETKNPLKGKIIDIDGNEVEFGDFDWNDIAVPDFFRTEAEDNMIWPITHFSKIKAAGLRIPRGLILEGTRGMGKTLLSRIIANKVKGSGTFIRAKPSDVQRLGWDYVFEIARTLEPSILYIEDIDTLTPSKQKLGGLIDSIGDPFLTDALDYIDGTEERGNVLILASTNVPDSVDLGVIDRPGRIDRRLVFDPNNLKDFGTEWKEKVFEIHLRGHKLEDNLDASKLAVMIGDQPYTGSHINELIHTAKLEAIRSLNLEDVSVEVMENIVLSEENFRNARDRVERILKRNFGTPEVF
ncbi:MAG: AAA family ATPase [Halobacteriota archaeon]|nr:AAA family ATPase [Halobacteriota archaeon]